MVFDEEGKCSGVGKGLKGQGCTYRAKQHNSVCQGEGCIVPA